MQGVNKQFTCAVNKGDLAEPEDAGVMIKRLRSMRNGLA